MSTNLDAALALAGQGLAVFPIYEPAPGGCSCLKPSCDRVGKHPRTRNGFKNATTDNKRIAKWWESWPAASLGVATGAASGIDVLDVDGPEGEASLAALEEKHGALPTTIEAVTGGGGRHVLFAYRKDRPFGDRVAFATGLDTRGSGGYIVAAPSLHESGRCYAWHPERGLGKVALAPAPDWLCDLVAKKAKLLAKATGRLDPLKVLAGIPAGQPGGRDGAVFRYACRLRAKGLELEEVKEIVLMAASRCAPPFPADEALKKVENAWKYASDDDRSGVPSIPIVPDVARIVDETEAALATSAPNVYHRGGELVRVGRTGAAIEPLPEASLLEVVAHAARFTQMGASGDIRAVAPPRTVVQALAARGTWPKLRELEAAADAPTLRPDGSVLEGDEPCYDAATRIYYAPSTRFPRVTPEPRHLDALAALSAIREVFCDFPFVGEADRSAALAFVLTLTARSAIPGPTPLFGVSGPDQGVGKGLLVAASAIIALGAEPPCATGTAQGNEAEDDKRILSYGRGGAPLVYIDNVTRPLDSAPLSAALTAPSRRYESRILGASTNAVVPVPIFVASGVNLAARGDLERRLLTIAIDPKVEHPDQRQGFRHPDLLGWVRAERVRLLVAALTVFRWFFSAGRPAISLPAFGSFETWSALVRAPLVLLGEADPCDVRARAREEEADPEREAQRALLELWQAKFGDEPVVASQVAAAAETSEDLSAALAGIVPDLDARRRDERASVVGYALRRLVGRVVGGRRLERGERGRAGATWRVVTMEPVAEASSRDVHAHRHAARRARPARSRGR